MFDRRIKSLLSDSLDGVGEPYRAEVMCMREQANRALANHVRNTSRLNDLLTSLAMIRSIPLGTIERIFFREALGQVPITKIIAAIIS